MKDPSHLTGAVQRMYPTPRAEERSQHNSADAGMVLSAAVKMWPTPKSSPSGPDFARASRDGSGGDDLATAVARVYPAPTVACATGGQTSRGGKRKDEPLLAGIVGGQLNPVFVEWLMGFPLGWTDLEDSETP